MWLTCVFKTMRVGIDARELCHQPAGKGQYLSRLLQIWLSKEAELVLYLGQNDKLPDSWLEYGQDPSTKARVECVQVGGLPFLWHRQVAKRLISDRIQVFFAALSYQSAIWNPISTVTVVHDLAIFKLPDFTHNRRAQLIEKSTLTTCAERSARIIAVSENTKKDLLEFAYPDLSEGKVKVIYEAPLLTKEKLLPLSLDRRESYFLYAGTLEPRKNIPTILKAYALLPEAVRSRFKVKLAGKKGWGKEDYLNIAKQLGIEDRVEFTGYLDSRELLDCYRKAWLFIFPSFYEGFGLPVVEAMAAGTPVITSRVSSLPEVVGEAGIIFNASDAEGFAQAMLKLVNDRSAWQSYSQAVYARAQNFRWEQIAQEVWEQLRMAADPNLARIQARQKR